MVNSAKTSTFAAQKAQMAESVDALVSNTSGATHPGSIPGLGTEAERVEKPLRFFVSLRHKGGSKNSNFRFLPFLVFSVSAAFRLFRCHFVKSHQSHSSLCFAKIGCGSE